MKYDFAAIEKKWQEKWEQEKPYAAVTGDKKPKFYGLIEFPYPSAAGLHVGHPRPFTAMDIICRKKRMQGYNVLNPIGFDAFGLPTENFAIKNHIHPAIVTKRNIENFTRQLKMLGYGFDWERVIDTTDPDYYRWTQWIFLQMYKHGLAYKTTMPVNWCTSCKCVLANEEVVEGVCERCGAPVVRKEKSQWMLRITKYADRLIDDLDLEGLDYIERVKTQQKNWIGRSTGTEVTFKTNTEDDITVYTTRVDTLFGVTYTVISPEHPLLNKWKERIANWADVEAYKQAAARKSDFERGELNKDKTGVRLEGIEVIESRHRQGRADVRLRLCSYELRHGHCHGRSRPRSARLGLCNEVRSAYRRGRSGRRHHQECVHAQGRYRHHGQLRLPQRHDCQGSYPCHEAVCRSSRAGAMRR